MRITLKQLQHRLLFIDNPKEDFLYVRDFLKVVYKTEVKAVVYDLWIKTAETPAETQVKLVLLIK